MSKYVKKLTTICTQLKPSSKIKDSHRHTIETIKRMTAICTQLKQIKSKTAKDIPLKPHNEGRHINTHATIKPRSAIGTKLNQQNQIQS